jgi:hypothetical protein
VIDYVTNVRDVVGSIVPDRYIPPAAVGLQTCHRETLSCGHVLEAAVSSLTRRRSTTAMEVENQGYRRAPVISGRNKQSVRPLPLSGHELLLRDARCLH